MPTHALQARWNQRSRNSARMPHNRAVAAEPNAQDSQAPTEVEASRPRPRVWRRFGAWVTVGVVLYVIVGGIVLLTVPDRLLAEWFPTLDDGARAAFLGPAANVVLFALGGTIALVGVGLSLSRHRQELEAAERERRAANRDRQRLLDDREREQARRDEAEAQRRIEIERALRERFVSTVKLLSDAASVNRQAALFALGALADDWDTFGNTVEVQVCIEVLTGYLRAPRSEHMLVAVSSHTDPEEAEIARSTTPEEISVKRAGYEVISSRIARDAIRSWSGRRIDLTGAHIDFEVSFPSAELVGEGGALILDRATFDGDAVLSLNSIALSHGSGVYLGNARVRGNAKVILNGAAISQGAGVFAHGTHVEDRGFVLMHGARLTEGALAMFSGLVVSGGGQVAAELDISSSARLSLSGTTITGAGTVRIKGAALFESGRMVLRGAQVGDAAPVTLPDGRGLWPETLLQDEEST